jgi:hypothetical protein
MTFRDILTRGQRSETRRPVPYPRHSRGIKKTLVFWIPRWNYWANRSWNLFYAWLGQYLYFKKVEWINLHAQRGNTLNLYSSFRGDVSYPGL